MSKKRSIGRRILIIILAIVAVIAVSVVIQVDDWKRDLSINYASLDAQSPDPQLQPQTFAETPAELAERVESWANGARGWAVESKELSEKEATIHLTRTTRLFRFVDDINVRLTAVDSGTQLDADSKSRVGKADFGQNPRNLKELVAGIAATGSSE